MKLHYSISSDAPLIKITRIIVQLALMAVLVLPSAYLIESPGYTFDVLGKSNGKSLIKINDQETEKNDSEGKILLLTVLSGGGSVSYMPSMRLLSALVRKDQVIMPSEALYPPSLSADAAEEMEVQEMHTAQDSAKDAALKFIKNKTGQEFNKKIETQIDDVGGPSAGLAFALGILQKSGKFDLTRGETVAITGTITSDGIVGPIGGINLKLEAAVKAGASILVLPERNYLELDKSDVPQNLRVISVNSLESAVNALLSR